jgi:hypothetical protein
MNPTSNQTISSQQNRDISQSKAANNATSIAYESNPFKSTINGLVIILKNNPMSAILLGLTLIVFSVIYLALNVIAVRIFPPLIIISILSLPVFNVVLIGSLTLLATRSYEGATVASVDLIKSAFHKTLPLLGLSILYALSITIGLILFIVPGVLFAVWFSLSYFAMYDENLGPIDAMKRSKELVSGHFIEIIGAMFAGSLMAGGGMMGVSGLLSNAITISPLAARYYGLKQLKSSNAPQPPVHWSNWLAVIFAGIVIVLAIVLGTVVSAAYKKQVDKLNNDLIQIPTIQTNPNLNNRNNLYNSDDLNFDQDFSY